MNNRPSHALSIPIFDIFINPVIFLVLLYFYLVLFQVLNHF